MNTPFLKNTSNYLILALLATTLLFFSCEKNIISNESLKCNVKAKEGSSSDLTGNWKLVKGKRVYYEPMTYDYSCKDIYYAFSSEGILTITGNSNQEIGYPNGTYEYNFQKVPAENDGHLPYVISINGKSIPSEVVNNILEINNSSLDGEILYLVRIE